MAEHREQIPIGDEGIRKTIILMKQYTNQYYLHPRIIDIAKRLKTEEAIYDYIVKKIRYVNDPPGVEKVSSAKHTILGNQNYGDCDDMSVALATLLKALGKRVFFRTVAWKPENKAKGDDSFTHVYVALQKEGKLIPLDVTMKSYGKEVDWFRKKDWLI